MRQPTQHARSEALFDSGLIRRDQYHFPAELRSGEHFINFVQRESSKIPCSPNSRKPRHINGFDPGAENLVTYDEAVQAFYQSRQKYPPNKALSGVMIATGTVQDLVVIDLDDVIDVETAYMEPLLREFLINLSDTFWELSMSATGAHGYLLDKTGVDSRIVKNGTIELIDEKAVALTAKQINGTAETIARADGVVSEWQSVHNEHKSNPSPVTPDSESNADSTETDVTVPEARRNGLDNESFWNAWGRTEDDLNKRERRVVTAMCTHNPKGKQLWNRGHDAELAKEDESRNDMALMSRLAWWGREADMFNFELSQAELERLFLASPLGKRTESKRPAKVSLTAYNAIWSEPE